MTDRAPRRVGVIQVACAVVVAYLAFRASTRAFDATHDALALSARAILACGRAVRVLSLPPGATSYAGSATPWDLSWRLLTLAPLRQLFAPGSFARTYAVLVLPAWLVALVACLALLSRGDLGAQLLQWARDFAWRKLLGAVSFVLFLAAADDAVRCYGLHGRLFLGVLRGCSSLFLVLAGAVLCTSGGDDSESFTWDQIYHWIRALALTTASAAGAVGGGTLLYAAAVGGGGAAAVAAAAAAAAGEGRAPFLAAAEPGAGIDSAGGADSVPNGGGGGGGAVEEGPAATDSLAFLVYGNLLLLLAAVSFAFLTERQMALWRAGVAVVRLLDAAVRVRPLLDAAARLAERLANQPAYKRALEAARRFDQELTTRLRGALESTAEALSAARAFLSPGLGRLLAAVWEVYVDLLVPAVQLAVSTLRRGYSLGRAAVKAAYLHFVLPVLKPVAIRLAGWARRHLVPLLWPVGSLAATVLFLRQAVLQRSVLPFGAAAYMSAVITGLMAGKMMRKSGNAALSRHGGALESLAASAYLNLDLGAGGLAAKALGRGVRTALIAVTVVLAAGRQLLAVIVGPVLGLLAAIWSTLSQLMRVLARALYPWLAAVYHALEAAFVAVWTNPELALVAAAAALAAAYTSHSMGLAGLAWRAGWAVTAGIVSGSARIISWLLSPPLRLLSSLAARLASLLGLSGAVSAWGARAGTDVASLFGSTSFGAVFVGLNLLHALLLKGWAVPALQQQGGPGLAAVIPVTSFVARSTGKVSLAPMYLTAAAGFLAGGLGDEVARRLSSLTAPTLWTAYLMLFWWEAARRVAPSSGSSSRSEIATVLRELRTQSTSTGTPPAAAASWFALAAAAAATVAQAAASRPSVGSLGRAPAAAASRTTSTTSPAPPHSVPAPPGADAAGAAAAAAPPRPSPAAALPSLERQLWRQLRRQRKPDHIFPAETCPVCFEGLHGAGLGFAPDHPGDLDFYVQVLRCGHMFHLPCVLIWLRRNCRCPVCREPAVGASRHSNMFF